MASSTPGSVSIMTRWGLDGTAEDRTVEPFVMAKREEGSAGRAPAARDAAVVRRKSRRLLDENFERMVVLG